MTHFVSSRDGLFIFEGKLKKVLDGRFFGMVHFKGLHYICGYKGVRGITREMRGIVLSFRYSDGEVTDIKEQLDGIDDGCHQMTIFKDHLYILETYYQRIIKIKIDEFGNLVKTTLEYINPWKKAVHMDLSKDLTENINYLHVNAITVQDGRFFVMCPLLKNMNPDKNTSKIQVFSEDWKLLDEYQLDRWFCHDIVPLGHELYFCDALNTVCKLNLVTRKVKDCIRLRDTPPNDTRSICRGLSIGADGRTIVSSVYNNWVKIVDLSCDSYYGTPLECSATFITRIDGMDYNNVNCNLRRPFLITLPRNAITFFNNQGDLIDIIFEKIKNEKWLSKQQVIDKEAPTLEEFLEPVFTTHEAPYIGHNESIEIYGQSSGEIKQLLCSNVFSSQLLHSTGFFFYPQGTGRGWHNNSQQVDINPHTSFRFYSIRTTGGTFFLYKHPISGKVHAVHDIDKTVNVFHLNVESRPFWHSIASFYGDRFSAGFRTGIIGVMEMGISKEDAFELVF